MAPTKGDNLHPELNQEEEQIRPTVKELRLCRMSDNLAVTETYPPSCRAPFKDIQDPLSHCLPPKDQRDHSYDPYIQRAGAAKLNSLAESSARLFVAYLDGTSASCSTLWKLSLTNKKTSYGVTAAHVIGVGGHVFELYLLRREVDRDFASAFTVDTFQRMWACSRLDDSEKVVFDKYLERAYPSETAADARVEYLKSVGDPNFPDKQFALDNEDPEWHISTTTVADILFVELPASWDSVPGIPISKNPAKAGDHFGMFAFPDIFDYLEPQKTYECTFPKIKTNQHSFELNQRMFYTGRNFSLGQVMKSGSMLNAIVSALSGSSGACGLNESCEAFAILVAAFYDKGIPRNKPVLKVAPKFYANVQFKETGDPGTSDMRNRNIFLSLHHPCVQQMVAALL